MAPTLGYDGKFLWTSAKYGSHSGTGVHARELLKELLECRPDWRFKVYALDDRIGVDARPNAEVLALPRYARSSLLRNLLAYPLALRRHPVDVLLSYFTLPADAPTKTILLLADVFWMANPGWLPAHIAIPRTLAARRSCARADRIITTTEFSRREIMRLLGVPGTKIDVVPHGVRTEFARRESDSKIAELRAQYELGDRYILSVNDIHPRKNLDGLVEAFNRLKGRARVPHRLAIAGKSLWSYPEFHRRVETSPFADDIRVLGYVPSEDLLALYQSADLFVYPSFYEGWGLQVHEAMIAGAPVAVANNSSMVEIAGDAADAFDPYDANDMSRCMERILTDPARRDVLIARGYQRVKQYSWRKAAEATIAICEKLLEH
jgi:alpha-1,3-rhamnosyl/mannosyltransferase